MQNPDDISPGGGDRASRRAAYFSRERARGQSYAELAGICGAGAAWNGFRVIGGLRTVKAADRGGASIGTGIGNIVPRTAVYGVAKPGEPRARAGDVQASHLAVG